MTPRGGIRPCDGRSIEGASCGYVLRESTVLAWKASCAHTTRLVGVRSLVELTEGTAALALSKVAR
jgi:hypothetical protein